MRTLFTLLGPLFLASTACAANCDRYRKGADQKSWKRFGELLTETLR